WALNFDLGVLHDTAVQLAENLSRFYGADGPREVRAALQQVDTALGINLRDDLLGALGNRMVLYSTPAEGALVLNYTLLLQVKDEKKLEEALDLALRGLTALAGSTMTVKKKAYHGAELREVHVRERGFPLLPSFTVHKGWL